MRPMRDIGHAVYYRSPDIDIIEFAAQVALPNRRFPSFELRTYDTIILQVLSEKKISAYEHIASAPSGYRYCLLYDKAGCG
jgi:hypothetical protein